jgi:tetratricopeptide (TPR) repeat protein
MCVLRSKVDAAEIDPNIPLLYMSKKNGVGIARPARSALLRDSKDEELRRWHSMAADWCMDHDQPFSDRLYHLIHSGRDREATRIAKDMRYHLMDMSDKDMAESVRLLSSRHEDAEVMCIAARMLLNAKMLKEAKAVCNRLNGIDAGSGRPLQIEIALKENRIDYALMLARDGYAEDVQSGIALGVCLLESSRPEEALKCLRSARDRMIDEGCLYRMDEVMLYEALAEMCMNNRAKAEALADAAIRCARTEAKRSMLRSIGGMLGCGSEHGVALEGVDVGDVQVPYVPDVPLEHRQPLESESPCQNG